MTKTITPPPGDENHTVKAPPPRSVNEGADIVPALRAELERLRAERDEARKVAEALLHAAEFAADGKLSGPALLRQIDAALARRGQLPWESA